jgi:hypothetical protein
VKKPICFMLVFLVLLVSTNFVASAAPFEGDVSYLFGIGGSGSQGFSAHALAELVEQVLVDGTFLSTRAKEAEEEEITSSRQLWSIGGLYRPVAESEMELFVGAGFLQLQVKEKGSEAVRGSGIYGKFGLKVMPMEKLSLLADLSYAPKYKEDEEELGHLFSARATLSYQVMDDLGLQGTVRYYKTSTEHSDTLVGGGVTFWF